MTSKDQYHIIHFPSRANKKAAGPNLNTSSRWLVKTPKTDNLNGVGKHEHLFSLSV